VAACDWDKQVKPCLPHLTPQVAALVELQWLAAMRPSEVVAITRGEIDRQSVPGVWLYRPSKHKTEHRGHELVKVFGPRAQAVLAPWMLAAPDDDSPIFRGNRKRGRYSVDGYNRAITRACVAAGVVRWTAYSLRHSARLRITQEFNLDYARACLGHKSVVMSGKYATAIDIKAAAEVARKIG
jgi:integrase